MGQVLEEVLSQRQAALSSCEEMVSNSEVSGAGDQLTLGILAFFFG